MDKFCKFCGIEHTVDNYPKKCSNCEMETFKNPLPVAVLLLPVITPDGKIGMLTGQRSIAPKIGEFGLIGGYVDCGDASFEAAAVRELLEEARITIPVDDVRTVYSYSDGTFMLVFCEANTPIPLAVVEDFFPTSECSSLEVLFEPETLCFVSHTVAMADWFKRYK